jgi:protein phosphatase
MYSIVEVGSFSYPKPTKEVNEDFLLLPTYDLESNIIFAIADGVGSSSSANKASECAINAISRTLRTKKFSVESALNDAKTAIDELTSLDEKYSDSNYSYYCTDSREKCSYWAYR